ncbi:MAG: N-acetyl-gamma-glutamyl-phosphate reductase [Rhodospirillaceae bacterium TMED167]|nr:N-acetyl-gamma-glutamyl-phosphate reductase [Rhodospirillaceae bacterium]OUW27591.1 MAG: N-acetyl-gamma-glutamyl-phosphate reductase [Rhodospirillaceae bacterium TMED167]
MTHTVFIDGEAGTTGLQILARLRGRPGIEIIHLGDSRRKDTAARAGALNTADVSILCLPDDASIEAVSLIDTPTVRIIDASIAYRTDPDWVFGFPEWAPGQRDKIAAATRVTNPGCYACGSIAILHPLVTAGLVPKDHATAINAVSGYSGGGKKLIAAFEDDQADNKTDKNFYVYGLDLEHKHIEEIRYHAGLDTRPLFVPSVGRFAQGMIVSVPLHLWALPGTPSVSDVHAALSDHYAGQQFVTVESLENTSANAAHLDPEGLNGTNQMSLYVFGNDVRRQVVVSAVLDNLGKGASGQAVQSLNLMLGIEEATGL